MTQLNRVNVIVFNVACLSLVSSYLVPLYPPENALRTPIERELRDASSHQGKGISGHIVRPILSTVQLRPLNSNIIEATAT
ncbi:hypothetical protein F4781DRAFT_412417 [Annulohypoxylon bovei var. microspora]|nr:hypothetical protein F4781DRAFT_412417 [Annulohypoxylon bovei var. microspora]